MLHWLYPHYSASPPSKPSQSGARSTSDAILLAQDSATMSYGDDFGVSWAHIRTQTHTHTHTYTQTLTLALALALTLTLTLTLTPTHTHTNTHTHTDTHTHTHIVP